MESIAQFWQEREKRLQEARERLAKKPGCLAEFERDVHKEFNRMELDFIRETLENWDQQLRDSIKRTERWEVVRKDSKKLVTSLGTVVFAKTLYKNKKTGKREYLIDRLLGIDKHERLTEGAKAQALEEAVQTSYRRGGEAACLSEDVVSKQTVKTLIHPLEFPKQEKPRKKKVVEFLYIDADEDHIPLQFKNRKGDLERGEDGWKHNTVLGKIVYVYEGIEPVAPKSKRHRLINPHYFSGVYDGEENKALWDEIFEYLDSHYDLSKVVKIYLNGDGAPWIQGGKKRIHGIKTVLDEFHMQKYLLKMTGHMLDSAVDARRELYRVIREGTKADFEELTEILAEYTRDTTVKERIREGAAYILSNWMAAKVRVCERSTVRGCSAEAHVSHVLSSRLSSRPMGWSRRGADRMCRLRAYHKNGGDMLKLVRFQKKGLKKAAGAETDTILSSTEMLHSEKNRHGEIGKYVEWMRTTLGRQVKEQVFFNTGIWIM